MQKPLNALTIAFSLTLLASCFEGGGGPSSVFFGDCEGFCVGDGSSAYCADGRHLTPTCQADENGFCEWAPVSCDVDCPTIAIDCAPGFTLVDTDGDGCDDNCVPACDTAVRCPPGFISIDENHDGCDDTCLPACDVEILCDVGMRPIDSNGDGCEDTCVSHCDDVQCPFGMSPVDFDGDHCPDFCEDICKPLACPAGGSPFDANGDGCPDTCFPDDCTTIGGICEPGTVLTDIDGDGCYDFCQPVDCPHLICPANTFPTDTDGDGCEDFCQPMCPQILCEPGSFPIDTDGDGCNDRCDNICPPIACQGTSFPVDSNGDGCNDECIDLCEPILCEGGTFPVDSNGDGCDDRCDEDQCAVTLEPRQSLFETHRDILAAFPMREALDRIAANSALDGGQRIRFEIISATGDDLDPVLPTPETVPGPSCNDGQNLLNPGFSFECPRAEELHNTNIDDVDSWRAIAIVNRVDAAALDGSHCGEQRVIFSSNAQGRAFIIFEAQIPNPSPTLGVDACRPIANFWAGLTGADVATRTAALRGAFLLGEPTLQAAGFGPFLSQANLSHGTGQVRVNFFDQGPWNLREYKLVNRGGNVGAELVPTAAHIFSDFFNDSFIEGSPVGALCRQAILDSIPNFLGDNINTMSWNIPSVCLANESPNIFSHNYDSILQTSGTSLAADMQTVLSNNASSLTPQEVAARMNFTQNCMGCHVQASTNLGGGLVVSAPPGFVHVEENSVEPCLPGDLSADCNRISNLLKNDFLPHRLQAMRELLCEDEVEEEPVPFPLSALQPRTGLLSGKRSPAAN